MKYTFFFALGLLLTVGCSRPTQPTARPEPRRFCVTLYSKMGTKPIKTWHNCFPVYTGDKGMHFYQNGKYFEIDSGNRRDSGLYWTVEEE
jgi:hypothetical protein